MDMQIFFFNVYTHHLFTQQHKYIAIAEVQIKKEEEYLKKPLSAVWFGWYCLTVWSFV